MPSGRKGAAPLWVPIIHPCWSGSILVLVEDAAEPVPSMYVEARDLLRVGYRFGERAQGCGSPEGPVRPVLVVEVLELPQRMQEVMLIPDERAVQQLVTACLHPSFHDRIHPRHLDSTEHCLDTRVLEDCVEQAGELAVAVPDQEPRPAAGVLQVHDEIPGSLDDPGG